MQLLLLLGELMAIFFFSRALTQSVFDLSIMIFRARSVAITIITILNFPGTVIHELSHLFTAEILGVRTGKLTLVPEGLEEQEIKAGSVMIAETDPFRRYAIGLAPLVTGMIAIVTLSYLIQQFPDTILLTVLFYYLLFAVSNSMFASPADLKGFVPFIITLGILAAAAYGAGLRIGVTGMLLDVANRILASLVQSMGLVVLLNLAGLLTARLGLWTVSRLTHRRIVR